MSKIAYCGAASLLVFAACVVPESNSVPMVELQPPVVATAVPAPAVQEAPVSQTIDIAIAGMT
jgi:hypothetical protein